MNKFKLPLAIIGSAAIYLAVNAFSIHKPIDLKKQLIGEWRNVYLKVKINTFNNTDKSGVIEADSTNWEARMRMKPIRTYYKSDGTYYSEYRSLTDSITKVPSGTWAIKGDTLVMNQMKPEQSSLKLHVSIVNDHATFSGTIDFDGDGKVDDEYFGIQKKYNH